MNPARLTELSLKRGLDELARRDRHVAAALERHGYPALRRAEAGFGALLRVIVGQQVSIQSAAAIWKRVEALAAPLGAERYMALAEADLRAAGLSRQKVRYSRSLAELVATGRVALDKLPALDDDAAVTMLTAVDGIGRWTAEVYLLFALGRADAWPADDLGLMSAMQRMKRLRSRPTRARMLALGEAWRPWRGAGAHLLWHYYRALRGVPTVPVKA